MPNKLPHPPQLSDLIRTPVKRLARYVAQRPTGSNATATRKRLNTSGHQREGMTDEWEARNRLIKADPPSGRTLTALDE
jgi:hypothetical protein